MRDDWEFYPLQVGDRPASIYVDLGRARAGADAARPWSAYVRLIMRAPRADGLASDEEYDALIALEDGLVGAVTAAGAAVYVGRCTTDGRRDFYFFTADPAGFDAAARAALAPFDGYGGDIGAREDPAWRSYIDFLLPQPPARRWILNRRVLEALEEDGDDLAASRPIEHAATFPTAAAREAFADYVVRAGYAIIDQDPRGDGAFSLAFSAEGAPADIHGVVETLHAAAQNFGGAYGGWSCAPQGPPTAH